MRFISKLSLLFILLLSTQITIALCSDEISSVTITGDEDDFYANYRWPFGSADFGSADNAFMAWERLDENDVAYYEGFLYFYSRCEREQISDPNVKDTVSFNLVYDYEQMKVTGSINYYSITVMDFDKMQYGEGGDWLNYASPQWYSRSAKWVKCEAWMDFSIDESLNQDNPDFFEITLPVDVTFKADVIRYGYPEANAVEKHEVKTVTENLQVTFRASINHYGQDVYPSISYWSSPGADYASRPTLNGVYECSSNPCSNIQVKFKDAKQITVNGPETADPNSEMIEFTMDENLEAESYNWVFSYKNSQGTWTTLSPIEMQDSYPLQISADSNPSITDWRDIFTQHGTKVGDLRELEMKVHAYSEVGGTTITSNVHLFKLSVNEQLALTISGPTRLENSRPFPDDAVFGVSGSGQAVDSVRWLDWYFYYKDELGEWQLAEKITKDTGIADLSITYWSLTAAAGEQHWDDWAELAGYHGQDADDRKILEMKVEVKAISNSETELATSNTHLFSVESIKKFLLYAPKTMEVSSVGYTEAKIVLDFGTLEQSDPIELNVTRKPHFIKVEFIPDEIETNIFTRAEAIMRLSADPSTIGDPLLPTTGLLVIEAKSGSARTTTEIELTIVPAEWLVLYYSCTNTYQGDSIQAADEQNLLEIIQNSYNSSNKRVGIISLIEFDQKWINNKVSQTEPFDIKTIQGQNTYFLQIGDGNVTALGGGAAGVLNMGDGEALKTFIDEAMERIPAKKTMLIISDHGEGVRGVVFDKGSRDELSIKELKRALEFNHMDVLIFDACYMDQIEVLYELRNCADYIVASETVIPVRGMNYPTIMQLVKRNVEPRDTAINIVEFFMQPEDKYVHLAAIDTSVLGSLVFEINKLSEYYIQLFTTDPPVASVLSMLIAETGIQSVETKTLTTGPMVVGHPYYDMELIENLALLVYQKDMEFGWKKRDTAQAYNGIEYHSEKIYNLTQQAVIHQSINLDDIFIIDSTPRLGIGIFFWPNIRYSVQNRVLADYEKYYKETSFYRDTSWYQVIENYQLTQMDPAYQAEILAETYNLLMDAMSGNLIILKHSQHELYPHVNTNTGLHVGINPEHWSRTMIDEEVPGSFYYDFHNGTKVIYIPLEYDEFTLTVDGDHMEEEKEDYQVNCALFLEGELSSTYTLSGEIELDTKHTTTIKIEDNSITASKISISKIQTESDGGVNIPGYSFFMMLLGITVFITVNRYRGERIQNI